MDRLTYRIDKGIWLVNGLSVAACVMHQDILSRLAAYEDTGLTPEEITKSLEDCADTVAENQWAIRLLEELEDIDHIKELLQAEQDGRLVVLPCKVGDTVWTNFAMSGWHFRDKDRPYSARVVFVGLNDSDKMGGGLINVAYEKHGYMMQFSFSEIGKFVFLTREEAEAALKGGAT